MARILLIDDDPHCLEMLTVRLRKEGHEVREARDGEFALHLAETWRPQSIFLDIRIPKIDGWEVCRRLKSQISTCNIPIVMLTGCSQDIQEQYGRTCGADDYLIKPWEWPPLLKTLNRMLGTHSSMNALQSTSVRSRIKNVIQLAVQRAGELSAKESAKVMGDQLLRFATSALVRYEDVFRTPSHSDFADKIKIVCEDLQEIGYWLGLAKDSKALSGREVQDLQQEIVQVIALLHESAGPSKHKAA